jgi:integrase
MKMAGNITRRGKRSWRIKVELPRDPATGARQAHYETVKGTRDDARKALVQKIDELNKGQHVAASAVTVGEYVKSWLWASVVVSPKHGGVLGGKTVERYRQLAEGQIIPHIGQIALQKLDTADIQDWHAKLLASGGKGGRPLGARTVGHAHRVLQAALTRAVAGKKTFRNIATVVKPPRAEDREVQILTSRQISTVIGGLTDHPVYPIAITALGTGLRRGELLALPWSAVNLDAATLRVERSIEETKKAGLRFKPPKSKAGRRTVPLAPEVIDALREHRKRQLETRLALGLGKPDDDALVFCQPDGEAMSPDKLSRDWARLVVSRKLPKVSFHALRHTHVSILIDDGLDVLSVSRRIGHGSAALTLKVYAHLFSCKDDKAVAAISRALSG